MRLDRSLVVAALSVGLAACHPAAPATPSPSAPIGAVALSPAESALRESVRAHHEQDVALLQRAVDISSGTQNLAGVRRVGDLFASRPARGTAPSTRRHASSTRSGASAGNPTLTFNPGLIAGGASIERDSSGTRMTVSDKTNIIAPTGAR